MTVLLREARQTSRFTADYLITLTTLCGCHVADALFQDAAFFPWTDWLRLLHSVFVPVEIQKLVATVLARVFELGGPQLP